ncbi:IS701 family transposase [Moorena producens PAL-8-15-08-1]|uniref:IS701 family transposase n=1 Tax=Moorena producens PAL-8-15-08-1 TaxID=1458985 RepID=A0A1D8TYM9_9CYAN|nr:IS701 family transposase [Moorena producens]AOW98801.1 IS701 family transposase [Moorena producens PAL-8-15-08-1]AOW99192.1 IS701 family transposase [Moorena producens PAL-8-15-08-1]AOX01058.1 IS701 family transposase [Moorena producens PAL-8-15-08-1]AOX01457.1 IS701 family transposase [Moorena producens PAL-8-15-08-1]AOX02521.1 IS701 family transposase [Moorena producens PAL-8-15-08-1]
MDVELQILKHSARDAQPTVSVIDQYCEAYKDLFSEVRSYECFKYLHLGIISPIKRKSLPEIAKVVGIKSAQSLHHFLANSPWSATELKSRRLSRMLKALNSEKITVIIDETGDRKKGKKTDYVARQYLGSIGKVDNGIVSVNAYGVYQNITFPLVGKIFKPRGTLKWEDKYKTKIELASEILEELVEEGLNIERVLADSLYGESSQFIRTLEKTKLSYVVAIRSNHGVWMPSEQRVRANKWCKFTRTFSNQKSETRYIREIVYGKKRAITYWEITTDPKTMPENGTSFVMTNLKGNLKKILGDLYGLRTWVEYAFRQCKQELGWTDYRFTKFKDIEKWWEIIFCVYTMISLNSPAFLSLNKSTEVANKVKDADDIQVSNHQQWNHKGGWKNVLNNFRLLIQPIMMLWIIFPWLDILPNSKLLLGLNQLISEINQYQFFFNSG